MNNYVKIVGTEDNKIAQTFFFDDTDEDSIKAVLKDAQAAAGRSIAKVHLAMWRMPNICGKLLTTMRYTTPCPRGKHRFETDAAGKRISTQCSACAKKSG